MGEKEGRRGREGEERGDREGGRERGERETKRERENELRTQFILSYILVQTPPTQGYSHLSGMEMTSRLKRWAQSPDALRP